MRYSFHPSLLVDSASACMCGALGMSLRTFGGGGAANFFFFALFAVFMLLLPATLTRLPLALASLRNLAA